ncbi:hypothetical protein HYH02_004535 [Chlamydomonas schloesseri]|uniref:Jumonji domain-containing protein n=1 Tax=Chlamydomonas schloesseri TaxID=2026947 RepID=A0A836B8A6_9CHLO|nr:hypothetical protein HYH02_004535 [Chlamydomonas schloesseri]|eukprot:KAG2450697.1 hypothetical protein HYH02_004535 [Chlamydomonas schloesseri]
MSSSYEAGAMCPVFHPTREEFDVPFCEYVRKVFRKHPDMPMFKVVPPKGWKPRRAPFPDLRNVQINVPIRQNAFGTKGAYRCVLVEQKPMSVAEFKVTADEEVQRLSAGRGAAKGGAGADAAGGAAGEGGRRASNRATSARNFRPPSEELPQHGSQKAAAAAADGKDGEGGEGHDPDAVDPDVERSFWANLTLNPPLYGADTPVSFFDEKLPYGWNLNHLGDLLQTHPKVDAVPGVTTPMTYFGMWRSFFGWHKEDADLYSVNFLHWGAPKVWYCVPPSGKQKFERMAQSLFPELHKSCPAFVRHKDIMLSPSCLKTYGVPYMRACQRANEFVVLNAAAYHAGFNSGFNCAEAVNFGLKEWIPIGKEAVPCRCSALKDVVRISMKLFDPKWVDPYETASESDSEPESSDFELSEDEEAAAAAAAGATSRRKLAAGRARKAAVQRRKAQAADFESDEEEEEEEESDSGSGSGEEEEEEEAAEQSSGDEESSSDEDEEEAKPAKSRGKMAAATATATAKKGKKAATAAAKTKAAAKTTKAKATTKAKTTTAAGKGKTTTKATKAVPAAKKVTSAGASVKAKPAAAVAKKAVAAAVAAKRGGGVKKVTAATTAAKKAAAPAGRTTKTAAAIAARASKVEAAAIRAARASKRAAAADADGDGRRKRARAGEGGVATPAVRRGRPPKSAAAAADGHEASPDTAPPAPLPPVELTADGRHVVTAVKPRSTVSMAAMALKVRAEPGGGAEAVVGQPMAIVGDAENGGSISRRASAAVPLPLAEAAAPVWAEGTAAPANAAGAAPVAAPAPAVDTTKRFFYLVQRLARPAPTPGHVLLRWLKEGRDGLFRPVAGSVWEEAATSLLPVHVQPVCGNGSSGGAAAAAAAAAALDVVGTDGGESAPCNSGDPTSSSHSAAGGGGDAKAEAKAAEPEAWRLMTPREQIVDVELRRE